MSGAADTALRDRWHARYRGWTRRIKSRNQSTAARLSSNHTSRGVGISDDTGGAIRIDRRLRAVTIGTSIDVRDFDASLVVNSHPDKIEKVPTNIGAALCPNATALEWIIRSRVGGGPGRSAIERRSDVKVPDAGESVAGHVACFDRTEESDRDPIGVGANRIRISGGLHAISRADVISGTPVESVIGGSGNHGFAVAV